MFGDLEEPRRPWRPRLLHISEIYRQRFQTCLGLCEFYNTESLLEHEVSEGEDGVNLGVLPVGAGVQPVGDHKALLGHVVG